MVAVACSCCCRARCQTSPAAAGAGADAFPPQLLLCVLCGAWLPLRLLLGLFPRLAWSYRPLLCLAAVAEFAGFEDTMPAVTLPRDSGRIWRGSYKGKVGAEWQGRDSSSKGSECLHSGIRVQALSWLHLCGVLAWPGGRPMPARACGAGFPRCPSHPQPTFQSTNIDLLLLGPLLPPVQDWKYLGEGAWEPKVRGSSSTGGGGQKRRGSGGGKAGSGSRAGSPAATNSSAGDHEHDHLPHFQQHEEEEAEDDESEEVEGEEEEEDQHQREDRGDDEGESEAAQVAAPAPPANRKRLAQALAAPAAVEPSGGAAGMHLDALLPAETKASAEAASDSPDQRPPQPEQAAEPAGASGGHQEGGEVEEPAAKKQRVRGSSGRKRLDPIVREAMYAAEREVQEQLRQQHEAGERARGMLLWMGWCAAAGACWRWWVVVGGVEVLGAGRPLGIGPAPAPWGAGAPSDCAALA